MYILEDEIVYDDKSYTVEFEIEPGSWGDYYTPASPAYCDSLTVTDDDGEVTDPVIIEWMYDEINERIENGRYE